MSVSQAAQRHKCGYVSGTECAAQGNDFELILMVKMETRHPIQRLFGSEFMTLLRSNVVKFGRQKNLPASVATAWIAPKICHGSAQQCTQSAPGFKAV